MDVFKISVGRSVHYVARGSADGKFPPVCRAAVVAATVDAPDENGGTQADLVVLNPQGIFFDRCPYDPANTPGTFHYYTDCKDA